MNVLDEIALWAAKGRRNEVEQIIDRMSQIERELWNVIKSMDYADAKMAERIEGQAQSLEELVHWLRYDAAHARKVA